LQSFIPKNDQLLLRVKYLILESPKQLSFASPICPKRDSTNINKEKIF